MVGVGTERFFLERSSELRNPPTSHAENADVVIPIIEEAPIYQSELDLNDKYSFSNYIRGIGVSGECSLQLFIKKNG